MTRRLRTARAFLLVLLALPAAVCAHPPITPPPAFVAELERAVRDEGAPGIYAIVMRDGRTLYEARIGGIGPDRPLPVASASKWVTAALILSLVDDGLLSLDQPIGELLPEFTGQAGGITLRQMLSFTSGQGSIRSFADLRQPADIALRESARRIAARPLEDRPGTVFKYGSAAFQVAGALAEQATGRSWADLFEERLARPLGMTDSRWTHPLRPRDGQATNPNLQGGLVTTARDYARFLTMIAGGGLFEGRRILSSRAIDMMERSQTIGMRMAVLPPGADGADLGYALGIWCERTAASGRCTLISSPGALGTYPWIDRESGLYGIFFTRHRLPRIADRLRAARRIAIEDAR